MRRLAWIGFGLVYALCACGEDAASGEAAMRASADADAAARESVESADEQLGESRGDGATDSRDDADQLADGRGAPELADELDAGTSAPGPADENEGPPSDDAAIVVDDPSGACANASDLERIAGFSVAELACEGAACAARALRIAFPLSIDATELQSCVDADAPTLADLSADCRACFVAIAQCVPTACVAAFGGDSACTQAPSTSFDACTEAEPAEGACGECQRTECWPDFMACSGLAP